MNDDECRSLEKSIAKVRYYPFFKEAWKIIEPHSKLDDNWHIKYLCDRLESVAYDVNYGIKKKKDLIICMPPSTSKSTMVTKIFPAWVWLLFPHMRFITASYSLSLSIDHCMKSRDIIQSAYYKYLNDDKYELRFDLNRKSEYGNNKTGSRIATSVGGTLLGKHADIFIIDDPFNPKSSISDTEATTAEYWFSRVVSTRLTNPEVSVKIIVMQRLEENDLVGQILKKAPEQYELITLPATSEGEISPQSLKSYYTSHSGLMAPNRYSREKLTETKKIIGEYNYEAQFLQRPPKRAGAIINPSWFRYFDYGDLFAFDELTWNFTIDPAYTIKESNSATGLCAYAEAENGNTYIRDISDVYLETPELVKYIPEYALKNGYTEASIIEVEPKGSGLSVISFLERETKMNVIECRVKIDKDKAARARNVTAKIQAGRVHLLKEEWNESFLLQCINFPNSQFNDDMIDAFTMALSNMSSNEVILGVT